MNKFIRSMNCAFVLALLVVIVLIAIAGLGYLMVSISANYPWAYGLSTFAIVFVLFAIFIYRSTCKSKKDDGRRR